MSGDDLQRLLREDVGVLASFLCGVGIVGPSGSDGRETVLLEEGTPPVPTVRQKPETVHEHYRLTPRVVRTFNLLEFLGSEWHDCLHSLVAMVRASCVLGLRWRLRNRTPRAVAHCR